jgi:hypothetical protein
VQQGCRHITSCPISPCPAQLFKDSGLIDKALTQTDCDLIFTKVKAKGARKISYAEFLAALEQVAAKKKTTADAIGELICAADGPRTSATKADYVKFHVRTQQMWQCRCRSHLHGGLASLMPT